MEPVSLTFGAVVAALIVRAAEKAGETAVEGGAGAVGRLIAAVRERFTEEGDLSATAVLERVEDPPVGARQLETLAGVVDAHVAAAPDWRTQLEALVAQAERDGVDVGGLVQQVYGDHNLAIAQVHGSTITIGGQVPPKG